MELNYEAKPGPKSCFKTAKFRMWFEPTQEEKLRGIIVVTPGSGGDGRWEMAGWQRFARRNRCAVIGVYLEDIDCKVNEDYIDAKNGSGMALLEAIDNFEANSKIPTKLPLLMWGHSAGGEYNYEFACFAPERVAAFVVNKGGIYYTGLAPQATRNVPGLFFVGEIDAFYRRAAVFGIYMMGKAAGAPNWRIVEEPNVGHDVAKSRVLSEDFFEKTLNKKG